jgi:hypothetical protein
MATLPAGGYTGEKVAFSRTAGAVFSRPMQFRVRPGGTAALAVHRVRRGRQIPAEDRRTPGGIGDHGSVAEKLRQQLDVDDDAIGIRGAE